MVDIVISDTVRRAAMNVFTAWANREIANASWLQRGAIQQYFDSHEAAIVDVIAPAVVSAYLAEQSVQADPASDPNEGGQNC